MTRRSIPSSRSMRAASLAFGAALALVFSSLAFAAEAAPEVATAEMHAGLAAAATDIESVHMHLHHAVNCLVGPDGAGFDSKQMNPCTDMGKSAIPDTTDEATKQALENALQAAQGGLDSNDLATAQKAAADADAMLKAHAAK